MAIPRCKVELLALQKIRPQVINLNVDDGTLMRFLRANNLNISKTEDSLRKFIEWMNNAVCKPNFQSYVPHPELISKFRAFKCGTDKEGRPVFYIKTDDWLPSGPIFEKFQPSDLIEFLNMTVYTKMYTQFLKSKHQQGIVIIDNEDIVLSKMLYEVRIWKGIQTMLQAYKIFAVSFPETLYKVFFINSPWSYMWTFNLVKHFIDEESLSKFFFYGLDKNQWKQAIECAVPLDTIPIKLGGRGQLTSVFDIAFGSKNLLE